MDDEKINQLMINLSAVDQKTLTKLFHTFSNKISALLTLCNRSIKKEEEVVEIEHLRRILRFCPLEEKLLRCKDKIFEAREHIINKNAKYFLDRDFDNYIKKDSKKDFIERIIHIIKKNYGNITEEEKELYWKVAFHLLKCVIEFKCLIGEHKG